MNIRSAIRYTLIGTIVIVLGALTGWYAFIHSKTQTTLESDSARGYNTSASVTVVGDSTGSGGGGIAFGSPSTNSTFTTPGGANDGNTDRGFLSRIYNAVFGITDANQANTSSAFGSALPNFGAGNSASAASSDTTPQTPRFWHAASVPVAGIGFVLATGSEKLRYVDRQNGYVADVDPMTGKTERRSNTLLPKTYEAFILPDGRVYMRSQDENGAITTFAGIVATTTTVGTNADTDRSNATSSDPLSGSSLAKNLLHFAVNVRTGDVLYVSPTAQGSLISKASPGGKSPKTLFDSSISNWRLTWTESGHVIIAESPADGIDGHAYELKDGALTEIIGATPGLTVLPHATSSAILYSASMPGSVALFSRMSPDTPAARIPVKTVTDKCVWAGGYIAYCAVPQQAYSGNFLDDWYRGALHSSDSIYEIDAASGTARMIYTPDTAVDVVDPTLDPTGQYLAFINGSDLSPYILRIEK